MAMIQPLTFKNQDDKLALALLNNLGVLYFKNGELDKAMEIYVRLLSLWKTKLCNHPAYSARSRRIGVGNALLNISHVLIDQGMLVEAMCNLDEALQLLRAVHGEKSTEAAAVLCLVGDVYRKQGKLDESLKVYNTALRHRHRALGKNHEVVASSWTKLALVLEDQGYVQDALNLFEYAVGKQREALGDDHLEVAYTCQFICSCCRKLGHLDKLLASMRETLRIFTLIGSPEEVTIFAEKVQVCERLVQEQQRNL
jgi:tetratricopeptide (TPR) repeat protein